MEVALLPLFEYAALLEWSALLGLVVHGVHLGDTILLQLLLLQEQEVLAGCCSPFLLNKQSRNLLSLLIASMALSPEGSLIWR